MNNQQARDYFKDSGLTYGKLTESDIYLLMSVLSDGLDKFTFSPHVYDDSGNLKINHKKTKSTFSKKNDLTQCYLEVSGPYFDNREAISFNRGGFIGFAGWADGINVQVFIDAFVKWVDLVKENK